MLRAVSCRRWRTTTAIGSKTAVAFEMGRMTAHCGGNLAFQEAFRGFKADSRPGYGEGVHPRLIGIDVEMIVREKDRVKVPIMAGMVEAVFWKGEFHRKQTKWIVDPGVDLVNTEYDWKTKSHGVTKTRYLEELRADAVELGEVRGKICDLLAHPATCLVGHMLTNDLYALGITGKNLSSRIIDTAYYYGAKEDGGALSLHALMNKNRLQFRANEGVNDIHDPVEDADAVTRLIEKEIHSLASGKNPPPISAPVPSSTRSVFVIRSSDIVVLIGKGGVNVKRLRKEYSAVVVVSTMSRPSPGCSYVTVTSGKEAKDAAVSAVRKILSDRLLEL